MVNYVNYIVYSTWLLSFDDIEFNIENPNSFDDSMAI
jgi:hypothetical protein